VVRPTHLLILGGTAEAALLANAARERFGAALSVTTSLAGRTRATGSTDGALRVGGFGGSEGLAAWLKARQVGLVVDATHPFASTISANARQACDAETVPRLIFGRAPWRAESGDDWRCVSDLDSAAALLPDIAKRAFLGIGSVRLRAFAGIHGVHLVVRMIDPPESSLPLVNYSVVLGRGPFEEASECAMLRRERIDTVVSRNSGGAATYQKIVAARALKLPVVMIAPPTREAGAHVETLEGALQWIANRMAGHGRARS
jgi:precorrin-6A/cobalt-precorrin-6A reductase